jgi:hypothetical protein
MGLILPFSDGILTYVSRVFYAGFSGDEVLLLSTVDCRLWTILNFFLQFFVKRLEIINNYRLILHKVLTKATEWIFSNVTLNC